MINLLRKEFALAMHPTSLIFLSFSAMLLIPNYPYYVTFFYTGLAIFFTCLSGRENHDVAYSLSLPVRKSDVVKARLSFVVSIELAQAVAAVPFAWLRGLMPLPGNAVGIDANPAFFGLALAMMGLFNLVFFGIYYKDVGKVGKAFVTASAVEGVYIVAAEAAVHLVPFFRDRLDAPGGAFLGEKLAVLAIGAASFAALTLAALRRAQADFEAQDL